jgi:para-nitrobenzyl esterase
VLKRYPASAYPSPSLALATMVGDEGRFLGACQQVRADDLVSRRSPVYAFEYAEPEPVQPGQFPYGAAHGSDVQWFFDATFPGAPPRDWTPEQRAFADRLTHAWATFAETGKPSWPAYRHDVVHSITMAHEGPVDLAREHHCDLWRTL